MSKVLPFLCQLNPPLSEVVADLQVILTFAFKRMIQGTILYFPLYLQRFFCMYGYVYCDKYLSSPPASFQIETQRHINYEISAYSLGLFLTSI